MAVYTTRGIRSTVRRAAILAATVAFGSTCASAATTATWLNAAAGKWTDGSNWSTTPISPNNGFPTLQDTYLAVIDKTGSAYIVTLDASVTIDKLTINSANATLNFSAGTLHTPQDITITAGRINLQGGAIDTSTITGAGGLIANVYATVSILDNVLLASPLTITDQSQVNIQDGMTLGANISLTSTSASPLGLQFTGNQTITGAGIIKVNGGSTPNRIMFAGGTTTLGQNIQIQAATRANIEGDGGLINNGTITANTGAFLQILTPSFINNGTLKIDPGAHIAIKSNLTTAQLGTVTNTGTGDLQILGTLDNTNAILDLAKTGNLGIASTGRIKNGTLTSPANVQFVGQGPLDNVTLGSDLTRSGSSMLTFEHDFHLNGHMISLTSGARMTFNGPQTLVGPGEIRVNPTAGGLPSRIEGDNVTIGPDVVIRTADQIPINTGLGLILGNGTFINKGTIIANSNGQSVSMAGDWSNQGVINVLAGRLNLGSEFTSDDIGTIKRGVGTVWITGTVNPGSVPLTLNADTGSWALDNNPRLNGITLVTRDGTQLELGVDVTATISNITLAGTLAMPTGDELIVRNGLTFAGGTLAMTGGISETSTRDLSLFGPQNIMGTGSIVFRGNPFNAIRTYNNGGHSIDPGIIIRTESGGGSLTGPGPIINHGIISAETSGKEIHIALADFTNDGILRAKNGGILTVDALKSTPASTFFVQTGGTANLNGPQNWAPLSLLQASDGRVNLNSDAGAGGRNLTLELDESTASLNSSQHLEQIILSSSNAALTTPKRTLVPAGTDWRYLDNGTNQATAWRAPAFDDSAWAHGNAQLGYGEADEATIVNSGPAAARFVTTYFRKSFFVLDPSVYTELLVKIQRDDGAVVYFNNHEIARSNMPLGAIGFQTRASGGISDADNENRFFVYDVNPAFLVRGKNVLAVEVHQANPDGGDLSFNLEFGPGLPDPSTPRVLVTNSLLMTPDSKLDLSTNSMIVHHNDPDEVEADYQAISDSIRSARSRGAWTGPGITSSIAAADSDHITGLAAILNHDDAGLPYLSTFSGEPVGPNDILVMFTWNGDMDLSGVVDMDDYCLIDMGFAMQWHGYRNGDLDYSGAIDADDYFLIDDAYVKQTSPLGGAMTSVPEPSAWLAFISAGFVLAKRRRAPTRG